MFQTSAKKQSRAKVCESANSHLFGVQADIIFLKINSSFFLKVLAKVKQRFYPLIDLKPLEKILENLPEGFSQSKNKRLTLNPNCVVIKWTL